jgi:magnesium-transporting ATPase (P-type)
MADAKFFFSVATTGLATGLSALTAYAWAVRFESSSGARMDAFTTLVFSQLFCALAFISETQPVWRLRLGDYSRLILVIWGTLVLQTALLLTPIAGVLFKGPALTWASLWPLVIISLIPVTVLEITKACRAKTRSSDAHHSERTQ